MDNYEYTELLKTLNTKVENIAGVVKPENIKARLKEIEELENDQNLWQDVAKAGAIGKEKTKISNILNKFLNAKNAVDDAKGLYELANSENDEDTINSLFAEADATQVRQLVLELLVLDRGEADFFVAPSQFPLLLFENLLLLAQIARLLLQLLHQRGGELAQLLRIHVRDVSGKVCREGGPVHGAQYAGVGHYLPSGDFPVARGANP